MGRAKSTHLVVLQGILLSFKVEWVNYTKGILGRFLIFLSYQEATQLICLKLLNIDKQPIKAFHKEKLLVV